MTRKKSCRPSLPRNPLGHLALWGVREDFWEERDREAAKRVFPLVFTDYIRQPALLTNFSLPALFLFCEEARKQNKVADTLWLAVTKSKGVFNICRKDCWLLESQRKMTPSTNPLLNHQIKQVATVITVSIGITSIVERNLHLSDHFMTSWTPHI